MASTGGYEQLREPAGDGVYQALDVFVLDRSGLVVQSVGFTERRHGGEGQGGKNRGARFCVCVNECSS